MEAETLRRGPDRDMSVRYRLFRGLLIVLSRLLFGFTVVGAEKVPKEGPLILASNHRRYADPVLVCMAVPRRIQWMGKKELFVFPFDKFFYFIGTFPVDRQKGGRVAIRTALSFLKAGWTLGIFPEGTRRKDYDPDHAPKSGVGMLASRANAPIFPVFVDEIPGPLQRLRGGKLRIYIGDPITSDNTMSGGRAYKELACEVLREIYDLGQKVGGGASS
jgi:1-acyl-sn-glycerol-3-phosphate acyltransferase